MPVEATKTAFGASVRIVARASSALRLSTSMRASPSAGEESQVLRSSDRRARESGLLTLAASWDDFGELAPLFDVTRQDVPVTAKAQDQLRAQNDKTVARLYGITDAEFAHLLRSFKGLAHKRPEYIALLH